jgi:DNA-binding NtrC family response regulator
MKTMENILIIDDDESLVHFLSRFFKRKGYAVAACLKGCDALEEISRQDFDLILLDYKMPEINGLDLLAKIKGMGVKTPVIMMTAYGTTDLAIETMKRGAYDYLIKPFERKDLTRIVNEALLVNRQMKEIVRFPADSTSPPPVRDRNALQMVGNSRKMQEIYKLIGQVAQKDISVLITGESGTGKELAARAIYHHSSRKAKPFIAVNCAAIPESLFESELFGHERGAFTGAEHTYIGKIERSNGGTLFLDEIGELSPSLQSKFLRVLQEGEIERIGGNQAIQVDTRIITATNKNLEQEILAGTFRKDLYFRLKVISIEMPPLRQRKEDIPHLADYFLQRFGAEYGKPSCYLSEAALKKVVAYAWPGNVRELENCIRRAVLITAGEVIPESSLMIPDARVGPIPTSLTREDLMGRLKETLEEILPEMLRLSGEDIHASIMDLVEETLVEKAMEACGDNQVQAAKILGLSRNTLRTRLKKPGA